MQKQEQQAKIPSFYTFILLFILLLCTILTFGATHYLHTKRNLRPNYEYQDVTATAPKLNGSMCSITMLINTMKRPIVQFSYLAQTLSSINGMANEFFQPCIVIGALYHDEVEEIVRLARTYATHIQSIVVPVKQYPGFASQSPLSQRKKQQAADVHSILNYAHEHVCKLGNERLALMEDDFEFCEHSLEHVMHILVNVKHDLYAGARFSYGLNGVTIFCVDLPLLLELLLREQHSVIPIDWVLEDLAYRLGKPYLTYRYQLMKHIGHVSSVGNYHSENQYPHCLETLHSASTAYDYDLKNCAHALYSPCGSYATNPDLNIAPTQTFIPTVHAANKHPLSSIKNLVPVKCALGQNCNECCRQRQMQCNAEYFAYINDCNLLLSHFACPSTECAVENGRPQSAPTAPRFDERYGCVVASRPSRMRCETSRSVDERLCACVK